jgi:nitroreductase
VNVNEAIEARRAYRSLEPVEISDELIQDLAYQACLAPSCSNNQPWRFVFVKDRGQLEKIHTTLSKSNKWIELASMIVAVFSRAEDDCTTKERIYHQFDTGMSTAFLILRATELGLVAHPVSGYDEAAVRQALDIPENYQIITLVNIGKHSASIHPYLTEKQAAREAERPARHPFEKFVFIDKYVELPPIKSPSSLTPS